MKKLSTILSLVFMILCTFMNAQINMSSATNTVNAGTQFYDNGGGSANYTNAQNLTQVITTTIPNFRMKVVFASLFTASAADSLSIYDGATPSPASFQAKYSLSTTPPNHYATGNTMTFRFVSDAAGTAAGWAATLSPFGIASITQTTTSQSSAVTFTVNGTNSDWTVGVSNVLLVHSATSASITVATTSVISATQLKVTFNIPCNADLGLYHLRVIQPTIGLSQMPNAFNVTLYDVNLTGTNILCAFNNTGAITSTVTGGTAAYSYSYSPGSITTANASNLTAGTYTLIVKDVNSCARTKTITLTQPTLISNGYPNSQTICSGQSAVLTMTASGGVGGYTYTWNGPNLSSTTSASTMASPLSSTTYTYSVMDANACVATSTLIVNVNPLPTVTVSASPNIVCQGGSSNLSASGSSTTYSWSNGASGNTTTVFPGASTVYSVTGTASNGCTQTQTVNVTVSASPVASATVNTPVCLGGTLSFINTSAGANSYSWMGPLSYTSSVVNPTITVAATYAQAGTYTLTAISAAGCSASTTVSAIVNALPSLTVTAGSSSLCAGNTFTANSTGATTYTWMPGSSTGASQTFTPSSTTTYTVSGTNAIGCTGTKTVSVIVNALTAINGAATAAGSPVAGKVILYRYEPFLTKFDSVTTQNTSGTGAYTFTSVPSGSYIVKAIPTASTLQVTYGSSAISWQNAAVVGHTCINSSTQNINVIPFTAISAGPGSLSGKIVEGQGFGQRPSSIYSPLAPGQPIGGIVVKGGKNPGGNMFAQTVTGSNGTYTLSGLPNNISGESYFILVDIPGLDTNTTYHKVITVNNQNYTNLDFTVDSAKVNPIPGISNALNDLNGAFTAIRLYPNPANKQVIIQYTLPQASSVSIELTNILGQTVKPVVMTEEQDADTYRRQIMLDEIRPGMYFLKLKAGRSETVLRLVITD